MSLTRKLHTILAFQTFAMLAILVAVSLFIIIPAFRRIEDQQASQTVAGGIADVSYTVAELDSFNSALALNDGTYNFASNPSANPAFTDSTITTNIFLNNRLNFLFILNNTGDTIFSQSFDLNNAGPASIPNGLTQSLLPYLVAHFNAGGDTLTGMVDLPEGTLLLSARQIFTRAGEGPAAGIIVMARYLDQPTLSDIQNDVGLPVAVFNPDDASLPADVKTALTSLAASAAPAAYIHSLNLDTTAAYAVINDIYGKPAVVLRVLIPQDVYRQAIYAMLYLLLWVSVLQIIRFIGSGLIINRLITSRVSRTADFARHVTASGDLSQRLPVTGGDEISNLGIDLNSMIDTLKHTQDELRSRQQNEEELRRTIESLTDAIATTDLEGNIIEVNDAAVRLNGSSKQELIGRNVLEFAAPGDRTRMQETMRRTIEGGYPGLLEIKMRKNDGSAFMAEVSGAVLKNAMGTPIGLVVTSRDISERKNAEMRLLAQHDIIERILATLPNAVMVIAESGNIILANHAFYSTFANHIPDITGMPLSHIMPEQEIGQIFAGALAQEKTSLNTEFRAEISGRAHIFSVTATAMPPHEVLLVFIDLSDLRERQDKLYLNDRLASIGELAAGVAHEMGSPLSNIIMFSELLAMQNLPEATREDIKIVESEARRSHEIIRNLLTFARKDNSVKEKVSIADVIDIVLKLRSHNLKVSHIKVITQIDSNLPDINADFSQIQQVFLNIVVNAEQAMFEAHKGGTLTITAATIHNGVKVVFADDGPGIPETALARIFEPFFTTKPAGTGTGLGLSICYGIVTQHDGRMSVASEINHGATFTVELPVENALDNNIM